MARPRKSEPLTHPVMVRLTERDFEHFTEHAEREGVTVPQLLRLCTNYVLTIAEYRETA